MDEGRTTFWPGAVTVETKGPEIEKEPDLIVYDSMAIPCGKREGSRFSHCIKLVFIVTDREKARMEHLFQLHKFTRIFFDRLQENLANHTLFCLLLFGCLYAPGERTHKAQLYLLSEKDPPPKGICTRWYQIENTEKNRGLWNDILDMTKTFKISSIITRMDITPVDRSIQLADVGLSASDLQDLWKGEIKSFRNYLKAAALVRGIREIDLPNIVLVIDKESPNQFDFIDFSERAAFSNYSTFCRHAVVNRRWFIERSRIVDDFNRLSDLSDKSLRDSYVASLIISATHNAASQWKKTFTTLTDIIIDKVPPQVRESDKMTSVIKECKSAKEALTGYFDRLDKWRIMNVIKLDPVPLGEAISAVEKRFTHRFEHIGVNYKFRPKLEAKNIYVSAKKEYLEEVIENLIQNAYESLQLGGTINPSIELIVQKDQAGMVRLAIEDNGPGFGEDMKEIIWFPNYTTKPTGTGQGLPFVKYAVETAFKGRTECYSAGGQKTGFAIYLHEAEGGK